MSYERRRGLGGRGRGSGGRDGGDPVSGGEGGRAASDASTGNGPREATSRRRAIISAAAVVGALVVGYAIAALWLFPGSASAEDASVVRVPDVVGLTRGEARDRMVETGLEMEVAGGLHHRDAPEGSVLSQSPLPGQYARPGAPVEAVLSRGPEVHTLPDVTGLSERQAGIVLERLGYEVEVERREDPIAAGRAIETRPPAGTELAVPGSLVLVVSEGAPIVAVPDLHGMHIDDAVEILGKAGLELGSISFDPRSRQAPGRIVGQYPPVGYSLRAGDPVELRVAGDRGRLNEEDGEEDEDASRDAETSLL